MCVRISFPAIRSPIMRRDLAMRVPTPTVCILLQTKPSSVVLPTSSRKVSEHTHLGAVARAYVP